jgi:hypothetical protein
VRQHYAKDCQRSKHKGAMPVEKNSLQSRILTGSHRIFSRLRFAQDSPNWILFTRIVCASPTGHNDFSTNCRGGD